MCTKDSYAKFNEIVKRKDDIMQCILSASTDNDFNTFLNTFDYCLNALKDEYRFILQNCFLNKSFDFWWVDFYCKSSFYRKRAKAVNSFVHLFETIYENFNGSITGSSNLSN